MCHSEEVNVFQLLRTMDAISINDPGIKDTEIIGPKLVMGMTGCFK